MLTFGGSNTKVDSPRQRRDDELWFIPFSSVCPLRLCLLLSCAPKKPGECCCSTTTTAAERFHKAEHGVTTLRLVRVPSTQSLFFGHAGHSSDSSLLSLQNVVTHKDIDPRAERRKEKGKQTNVTDTLCDVEQKSLR